MCIRDSLRVPFTVVTDETALVPIARYSGSPAGHLVTINPRAARDFPPNTWAFILGHEVAHAVDDRARHGHGKTFKQVEWMADEVGASYAIRAGFHLDAHLGWVFSRPNAGNENYGSEYERAQNLFHLFRPDRGLIQNFQNRYRMPLAVVAVR